MATTGAGYPYPTGGDAVIDGNEAIQALAEAAPRGVLLSKTLGANFTVSASVATAVPGLGGSFTIPPGTKRLLHTVYHLSWMGNNVNDAIRTYTQLGGLSTSWYQANTPLAGQYGQVIATLDGDRVVLGPGTFNLAVWAMRIYGGGTAPFLSNSCRVDVIDDGPAV